MTAPETVSTANLGDVLNADQWQALRTYLAQRFRKAPVVMGAVEHGLLDARPFKSSNAIVCAFETILLALPQGQQLEALRAHPPTEGEAGFNQMTKQYEQRFGWPFILCQEGPRRLGLTAKAMQANLSRRIHLPLERELHESIQQMARELQCWLDTCLSMTPMVGDQVWDWQERLASHTDSTDADNLTVTYLTPAHRACAQEIATHMRECGCDEVHIDAVGNVVGLYNGQSSNAPRIMTGSHYDTVRNGGKYDGRLGICVPLACIAQLHQAKRRLSHAIEVVAIAEEEGQRYKATFLGSAALTGEFNDAWLDQADAAGITMRQAMLEAGLDISEIPLIKRDPTKYRGFIEVHIEQGPVLAARGLPLGVVTSINGSVRFVGQIQGLASHAGTTPMNQRTDAAVAVAEVILLAEQAACQHPDAVATVGQLQVPNGSINVVPGQCHFSLDVRAPIDAVRDAVIARILAGIESIQTKRGVRIALEQVMQAAAAPSDPDLQQCWENAVTALGLPVFRLPSGAGHDAMKLHTVMPQAMLFVRGEHQGISHNPLESTTSHDMDVAVSATLHLLENL
jgi:N-carbamoyl-L-amino-acid hydrolase